MTNWTNQQKSDNGLMSVFSANVKLYLGIKDGFSSGDPARWLLDSFQLMNISWPNMYGDYSFLVVPASKALENWIIIIATDINIEIKTDKIGVIRDQIESVLNPELLKIEKNLAKTVKLELEFLKLFIKEYRYDIVHQEKKIESFELAKSKIYAIYERINSITDKLLEAKIISIE